MENPLKPGESFCNRIDEERSDLPRFKTSACFSGIVTRLSSKKSRGKLTCL